MDEGIWATWFDLSNKVRPSHIKWLQNTYLPEISARPGIAWAAYFELHPEIYTKQRSRLTHTTDPIGQAMNHLCWSAPRRRIFFPCRLAADKEEPVQETRARLAEARKFAG